jgi:hypothetical protein
MKTRAFITGIAMLLATGAAHATEDYCAVVIKTSDGFLALREGPGQNDCKAAGW